MTDNNLMYVICFYWQGDRWQSDGMQSVYINNLFRGVRRHLTLPFEFICFTNEPNIKINLDKLIQIKPFHSPTNKGVLPRMFMFSEQSGLFGKQVLALDLDIIITGALDDIASYRGAFCSRSKFAPNQQHKLDGDVTSFFAGEQNENRFWRPFVKHTEKVLELTGGRERYWFRHVIGETGGDRWDKLFPNQLISYKRHVRTNGNKLPDNCRIVSCHGKPRPHELTHLDWVNKNWR